MTAEPERRQALVLTGAVFGLATALAELCILGVEKLALKGILWQPPDIVWMVPLAYVVVFASAGLALSMARRLCFPRLGPAAAIGIFSFLGVVCLGAIYHPKLQTLAGLLLAAGIGVQSARWARRDPARVDRGLRRALAAMAAGVAAVVGGDLLRRYLAEQRALARVPGGLKDRPNILLIVLDTVRAANLSVYGYHRPTTPFLEALADEAVVFDRAISTAPWTLPSHASMFTGRFPHELTADWTTPLDEAEPTVAEVLSAAGYLTGGFSGNTAYGGHEFGLQRGFVHYEAHRPSLAQIADGCALGRRFYQSEFLRDLLDYYERPERRHAHQVVARFLEWRRRCDERPYFAFLNLFDAHAPYYPPEPFKSAFAAGPPRPQQRWLRPHQVSQDMLQGLIASYDACIAALDNRIRCLLTELDRRGELGRTVVIITSDHGEEFGEHDSFDHGNTLYLPSVHVPLLVRLPGATRTARRVDAPVSLRDLAATVLSLAGVRERRGIPGTSWERFWSGAAVESALSESYLLSEVRFMSSAPKWIPISRGDMHALIRGNWRYIRNGDGTEELYRFPDDHAERHDMSGVAAAHLQRMRLELQALLAQSRQRGVEREAARNRRRTELAREFAIS